MRAGFALQLVTVRWLGMFLEDPLDVPDGVLEFVAGKQLGMADLSTVTRYTEREHTRFDHQWEIKKARGYREFDDAEDEFAQWAAARSRATGDGPKAVFTDGLAWLRERNILLPGVTTIPRTFCVLEQFWRNLKRRDIWADASTQWRNPQARLLEGEAWQSARGDVLTSLGLPGNPAALMAEHSRTLDAAYREVGGRLAVNWSRSISSGRCRCRGQ